MINFSTVTNYNVGLGDCLSCFNTNRAIWSPSSHLGVLKKYTSLVALDVPHGMTLSVSSLHEIDFQGEHLFNRVRIVSGLAPLSEPRAILDLIDYHPIENNIAFSFDVGVNAFNQKVLHPRARELYPEHRKTVQEFISKNSSKFNFIEVGKNTFNFLDSFDQTGENLENTINILRRCKFYFGMHSGLMHLATAIGLKCLVVLNFPDVEALNFNDRNDFFSTNKYLNWERHWLYPQHRYLHEDVMIGDYAITVENFEKIVLDR